jgi:thioredoxin 1
MVELILNKDSFDKFIKSGNVVVDFFAEWCGPCKMIAPQFEELSTKYLNIRFCKVDVDTCSDIAGSCGVQAMPTFILFKDGVECGRIIGANIEKIKSEIEKFN